KSRFSQIAKFVFDQLQNIKTEKKFFHFKSWAKSATNRAFCRRMLEFFSPRKQNSLMQLYLTSPVPRRGFIIFTLFRSTTQCPKRAARVGHVLCPLTRASASGVL